MTADEKRRKSIIALERTDGERSFNPIGSTQAKHTGESKKIRKISPLGFRVLVRIEKESNVSEGGLYLPEGTKQSMQESLVAKVIEVASALDHSTDEETNVSGVPLDAYVLIPKHVGVKVPWDDNLRIIETKDILAVINEISVV